MDKKVRHTPKYKHQPTRKQVDGLEISLHKDKKGKTKGFTIWSDGLWVLDGSCLKDKDENTCRINLGHRNSTLQFEHFKNSFDGEFLELRSKIKLAKDGEG